MIVVATKIDAAQDPARIEAVESLARERGLRFLRISTVTGEGVEELKRAMADVVFAAVQDKGSHNE